LYEANFQHQTWITNLTQPTGLTSPLMADAILERLRTIRVVQPGASQVNARSVMSIATTRLTWSDLAHDMYVAGAP
jgi:hypothetical protein